MGDDRHICKLICILLLLPEVKDPPYCITHIGVEIRAMLAILSRLLPDVETTRSNLVVTITAGWTSSAYRIYSQCTTRHRHEGW